MVKLKIIALFLGLLMTSQMLPITQIGQMLGTNQWVEELPHNAGDCGKVECSLEPHFLPPAIYPYNAVCAESKIIAYLHSTDQIPSNHFSEHNFRSLSSQYFSLFCLPLILELFHYLQR